MKKIIKKLQKSNIFIIISFVILCFATTTKTLQNDTFYTIKIGEYIFNSGIDMRDHFAWIANLPYTYPHWLYDCFIYQIYKTFGFIGIHISTITLYFILILLIYYLSKQITKSKAISYLLTVIVIAFFSAYATARAQLVSYSLLLIEIYAIEKFIKTKEKKYIIILIIDSLLLANIHCAMWPFFFVLFLPYLVANFASWLYCKKEENKAELGLIKLEKNKNVKYLLAIIILCLLTGFLTPIGDTPFTYLINQFKGNSMQYINEHQAITIKDNLGIFILIAWYSFMILAFKVKIKLSDIFLMGGIILLALESNRSFALFLVLGTFFFARTLKQVIDSFSKKAIPKIDSIFENYIAVLVLIILCLIPAVFRIDQNTKDTYIDEATYPVEASNYIKENLDLNNLRLYNQYNYGSYLIYRNIPVTIDSRADLYTIPFNKLDYDIMDECMDVESKDTENYETFMTKHKVNYALTYNSNKLNSYLFANVKYKKIYSDSFFSIYEKIN